ncbi:MAG: NAD(P)/FAD-dependent oxidoreductase [Endomicrobium sp.]|jgi:dihydrolipoamide dehydrogenase|nr:NAD(P)/FAD-dependent oxidoreductase [Endomicrobium sp.]
MSEINAKKYDIAVIGCGPGGFTAAVRAAQLGAKVVIIENSEIGGTCLNCGCIPTKFFWQALKTKQKIQKSYEYGFKINMEPFSFADIATKKDKNIANLRKGMELILSSYGITLLKGRASFKTDNTVLSGENEIYADKIIIASGTKPSSIKALDFDGGKIIDSTHALNLKEIPQTLLVIGGGAIGVELSTIFAGFGSKVTIAEYRDRLIPGEDAELSEEIKKSMQRQGIEVLTECKNAADMAVSFEKVLAVTGRTPCGELNIKDISINTDEKGFIKTDEYCRTNIENIYAVGDITGKNLLAYTAQNEGAVAAENAVKGNSIKICDSIIVQAVFSIPQCASVKVTDFEDYKDIVYGKFPFTASARAFIEGERVGFIKCAVEKNTKKLLGFWIVGVHAEEIINTAAVVLKSKMNRMYRESLFHPSLSEGLLNAYEDALGKCTEIIKRK